MYTVTYKYKCIYIVCISEKRELICLVIILLYPGRHGFYFLLPMKRSTFSKVILYIGESTLYVD